MKHFKKNFMKYFKFVDTLVLVLCFVSGVFVIANYSEIPNFIFISFWVVLILAYIRILDFDAFFIVKDMNEEDDDKESL